MPIQDHIEMGYSGQGGDPSITDLIAKMEGIDYYEELFTFVYGDANIAEAACRRHFGLYGIQSLTPALTWV